MANVYCGGANKTENPQAFSANCEALHSSVVGPSLNTVSIIILGKCYAYVAEKLTDWGTLNALNYRIISISNTFNQFRDSVR